MKQTVCSNSTLEKPHPAMECFPQEANPCTPGPLAPSYNIWEQHQGDTTAWPERGAGTGGIPSTALPWSTAPIPNGFQGIMALGGSG